MNTLFQYLVQSSICLIIFYGLYWIFLRRDTFFYINRFYLIGSILLSLIIPLIDFSQFFQSIENNYLILLDPVTITANEISDTVGRNLTIFETILIIYITGITIFLVRFLIQLIQLMTMITRYGITKRQGINFVFMKKQFTPFSFFNIIFINSNDIQDEKIKGIIAHELVHIRQMHSIDLLILEFITILLWFNPFIWFYRKSIKSVHEYLADEGVLIKGMNKSIYQEMLFQQSTGIQVNDLTNNFNQSLIKRRFIMMSKSKSKARSGLKMLIILPAAVLLVSFISLSTNMLAQEETEIPPPPPKVEKVVLNKEVPPPPPKVAQEEDKVYKVVEKMPEYPGGKEAMYSFFGKNVVYPDIARKQGVSAKVFVGFIVEKDGSIKNANIIGIKTPVDKDKYKEALDALKKEGMRVVYAMPKWKPGVDKGKKVRVEYALPISFNLDKKAKEKKN